MIHIQENQRHNMEQQYCRDTIPKLHVPCLVMPRLHAEPRSDASAHNRQNQQRCLRYAPFAVSCPIFVYAIHDECNCIHNGKTASDKALRYIHIQIL